MIEKMIFLALLPAFWALYVGIRILVGEVVSRLKGHQQ